eukprot:364644-Chlamydomonas_euryale.AAC.17
MEQASMGRPAGGSAHPAPRRPKPCGPVARPPVVLRACSNVRTDIRHQCGETLPPNVASGAQQSPAAPTPAAPPTAAAPPTTLRLVQAKLRCKSGSAGRIHRGSWRAFRHTPLLLRFPTSLSPALPPHRLCPPRVRPVGRMRRWAFGGAAAALRPAAPFALAHAPHSPSAPHLYGESRSGHTPPPNAGTCCMGRSSHNPLLPHVGACSMGRSSHNPLLPHVGACSMGQTIHALPVTHTPAWDGIQYRHQHQRQQQNHQQYRQCQHPHRKHAAMAVSTTGAMAARMAGAGLPTRGGGGGIQRDASASGSGCASASASGCSSTCMPLQAMHAARATGGRGVGCQAASGGGIAVAAHGRQRGGPPCVRARTSMHLKLGAQHVAAAAAPQLQNRGFAAAAGERETRPQPQSVCLGSKASAL